MHFLDIFSCLSYSFLLAPDLSSIEKWEVHSNYLAKKFLSFSAKNTVSVHFKVQLVNE